MFGHFVAQTGLLLEGHRYVEVWRRYFKSAKNRLKR
jgi:hypothetical protein